MYGEDKSQEVKLRGSAFVNLPKDNVVIFSFVNFGSAFWILFWISCNIDMEPSLNELKRF